VKIKRRAFLTGLGVLTAAVTAPVRWALAAARRKIQAPRISRVGQVFALSASGSGSWPSYSEAY
jgi:hypothetical protein